jgi:HlyD family secretion protein
VGHWITITGGCKLLLVEKDESFMISKEKKVQVLVWCLVAIVGVVLVVRFLFLNKQFRYAGTLEVTKVDMIARLPAAITKVTVYEGDRVTAGQTLITFACENYKITERLAREDYDRNKQLVKNNFISPSNFDQYRSKLEDAQTKVSWCTLISPLNGKVLSRYHEPGEWMDPGLKILTLADIRDIWAYIYVPQPLVAKLSIGMKLNGTLPELKGRVFEGKIIKINDEAEFTPKNVQTQSERERLIYGVKVSFLRANADEVLKPGMTIEIVLPK